MTENKFCRAWLRHHFTYSWWKYLLLVAGCVLGVNMLFTMTAYRPPEEKKVELYVLNDFVTTQTLQDHLWPQLLEKCPDQEELTVLNINLSSNDAYAYMQFSTYVAAKQGDVCVMPAGEVAKLAAGGAEYAFLELTPYIESGVIDPKGIDLSGGVFPNEAGEDGLYAIPADSLHGLSDYGNDPEGSYLVILAYGGNDAVSAHLLGLMIDNFYQEKPDDYDAVSAYLAQKYDLNAPLEGETASERQNGKAY